MRPPCARRAGSKAGRHRPSAAANARTGAASGRMPPFLRRPGAKHRPGGPKRSPPAPKNPPKTPGTGQPRGKNALRQRARLWQCRLPRTKSRLPSPGPDGLKRHPISFDHPRRNGRTNAPKRKRMKHFSFSFGKKEKNSFGKPPVSVYFIQYIC